MILYSSPVDPQLGGFVTQQKVEFCFHITHMTRKRDRENEIQTVESYVTQRKEMLQLMLKRRPLGRIFWGMGVRIALLPDPVAKSEQVCSRHKKVHQVLVRSLLVLDWSHMTRSDQWVWADMMRVILMPRHLLASWSLSRILFPGHICKETMSSRWCSSRPVEAPSAWIAELPLSDSGSRADTTVHTRVDVFWTKFSKKHNLLFLYPLHSKISSFVSFCFFLF